ncbi:MAG TPA: flagellar motor protein MotD [Paucimonas sp.]|nr:flagellar motor protein MotD [Paucimonas sp.]
MARRRFEEEPDNHDRWLVSYADLLTLLFAFFVVMYAISSVNEGKYRVLSNALGTAFGRTDTSIGPPAIVIDPKAAPVLPRPLPRSRGANEAALKREKEHMTGMARDILKALAPLISQGKVRVTQNNHGVNVEINASVLFAQGEAGLTDESSQALRAVAQVLKNDTHAVQVEGHTDNVPIRNAAFPSNWELSAVRAGSVVRLFVDNGIAEGRLTAVGHGANRPVAPNDTAEGRQRNRRVQIMILSDLPDQTTELPVSVTDKP